MLSSEQLARRIQRLRRRLGLTQEALAERAGVSADTIGRLEQAVGTPSLQTMDRVAEALGTTVPVLLARGSSEEFVALVDSLPEREQEYVRVMVRALATHIHHP